MSLALTTVTIGAEDRRLTLGNAQVGRLFTIGSSWNSIRIGMLHSMVDSGANITGTPRLFLGVLNAPASGVTNGPLSATTSHYVGMRTKVATWVRTAGPPAYYNGASGMELYKRVGSTGTSTAAGTTSFHYPAAPTTLRQPFYLEITKGSPNFTLAGVGKSTAPTTDCTEETFLRGFEPETITQVGAFLTVEISSGFAVNLTSTAMAASEADGVLNAVCVAWDKSSPLWHINSIAYKVLS